ncbi:hypothetical protein GALL_191750 [mine drainage metagenome]|uniref:Uncharacterized protein n=1 Tax=mine drainage metagenome TaxID=410659 RepID=A0A1J5RSY9_9ZZZZ
MATKGKAGGAGRRGRGASLLDEVERNPVPTSVLMLAEWLEAVDAGLEDGDRSVLASLAGGRRISELAAQLRDAASTEAIRSAAELLAANESGCACSGVEPPEPTPAQLDESAERLARAAVAPLVRNGSLRSRLAGL